MFLFNNLLDLEFDHAISAVVVLIATGYYIMSFAKENFFSPMKNQDKYAVFLSSVVFTTIILAIKFSLIYLKV
jgi:hypothetical protein